MARKINTSKGDRSRHRAARKELSERRFVVQSSGKPSIRLTATRRKQISEEKLTMAYWLLAKRIVENQTDDRELTRERVEELAEQLDQSEADKAEQEDKS